MSNSVLNDLAGVLCGIKNGNCDSMESIDGDVPPGQLSVHALCLKAQIMSTTGTTLTMVDPLWRKCLAIGDTVWHIQRLWTSACMRV